MGYPGEKSFERPLCARLVRPRGISLSCAPRNFEGANFAQRPLAGRGKKNQTGPLKRSLKKSHQRQAKSKKKSPHIQHAKLVTNCNHRNYFLFQTRGLLAMRTLVAPKRILMLPGNIFPLLGKYAKKVVNKSLIFWFSLSQKANVCHFLRLRRIPEKQQNAWKSK